MLCSRCKFSRKDEGKCDLKGKVKGVTPAAEACKWGLPKNPTQPGIENEGNKRKVRINAYTAPFEKFNLDYVVPRSRQREFSKNRVCGDK